MTEKKKNLLFYILLFVGVVVVITTYVFIYLAQINNDYLYFEKRNISVNLGESYTIEDLGINTNIDKSKLTITYNDSVVNTDAISFDKAGDFTIVVKSKKLKATLYVLVLFNNIDEYFDIYANVGVDKISLSSSTCIELYLPNGDKSLAESEGYVNSFDIGVNYLQGEYNFDIVCGNNLLIEDGKLYAKVLGECKVYLNFETFGKSFEFSVLVKAIPIIEITTNHRFDTIYATVGDVINFDINILPSYATHKYVTHSISGTSIVFNGNYIVASEIGEGFVTLSGGIATCIVKVVVCEIPDNMTVEIVNDFAFGNIGKATVNFYSDEVFIDSDYYIECYVDGIIVENEVCFKNFSIKHNTFSLEIITESKFIIKIISYKNSSLTFEIYANN